MAYTKKPKEAAIKIFKDCIIAEQDTTFIFDGVYEEEINFDEEIETFLDKYCIAHGKEENIIKNIVLLIKEEIDRRMDYFTCESDEAESFLRSAIEKAVLSREVTMCYAESLYSTFYDVFEYKVYMHNGQYFIMDWREAEFDPDYQIDGYGYCETELIDKAIEKYQTEF